MAEHSNSKGDGLAMTLSVCALTCGNPYAPRFLAEFRQLARDLGAEFVVAGDGERGVAMARQFSKNVLLLNLNGRTPEYAIAPTVSASQGDWILRFDDDETCSAAMREWLLAREWERGVEQVYSFPYAWLWGDERHFITSAPFWVDPHARLMPRQMTAQWGDCVHAGNPFGVGKIVPVAHLHHKFIVRTFEQRLATARQYDGYAMGAGTGSYYGQFTTPETHCKTLTVREVGDGAVELSEWIGTGKHVGMLV